MKNKFLNYCIALFFLCSSAIMFAQPGTGSDNNGIDDNGSGDTTPGAPIDDYVWVLLAIGIVFVFYKYRAIAKQKSLQH